jgi:uncharacterized phage-like protein YoqJ
VSQQWSYAFFVRGFGCALFILGEKHMIIAFCGHADYTPSEQDEQRILNFLEQKIGDQSATLYLGGYGGFDQFAFHCGKKYQRLHPNVKLFFVTPYLTEDYQKKHLKELESDYDGIIYPPLERVPPKFAILLRNRWIAEQSDCVIAYVTRSYGGAYQMLQHAKRHQTEIWKLKA